MISETDVCNALRAFLIHYSPAGTEVFRGQDNRVPEPKGDSYIMMTPGRRVRLATNVESWDTSNADASTRDVSTATQLSLQLDFHGATSADVAQLALMLFRDVEATQFFADSYPGISPLYCEDAFQAPFINGENQYENRWTATITLQISPVVTLPAQFAKEIDLVSERSTSLFVDFYGDNSEYLTFLGRDNWPLVFTGTSGAIP